MSTLKVLDTLQKLELRIAELYRWLADAFAADAETSGLFFRLSLQEQSHANLIAFQRRVILHGGGQSYSPDIDMKAVTEVIAAVDAFRAANPKPTLEQALDFARTVEDTAAEKIHLRALAGAGFGIEGLIATLASDDQRHEKMLARLAARFEQQAVAC